MQTQCEHVTYRSLAAENIQLRGNGVACTTLRPAGRWGALGLRPRAKATGASRTPGSLCQRRCRGGPRRTSPSSARTASTPASSGGRGALSPLQADAGPLFRVAQQRFGPRRALLRVRRARLRTWRTSHRRPRRAKRQRRAARERWGPPARAAPGAGLPEEHALQRALVLRGPRAVG